MVVKVKDESGLHPAAKMENDSPDEEKPVTMAEIMAQEHGGGDPLKAEKEAAVAAMEGKQPDPEEDLKKDPAEVLLEHEAAAGAEEAAEQAGPEGHVGIGEEAMKPVDMEVEGFSTVMAAAIARVRGEIGLTLNTGHYTAFKCSVGFDIPVPLEADEVGTDAMYERMSVAMERAVAWAESKAGAIANDNEAALTAKAKAAAKAK